MVSSTKSDTLFFNPITAFKVTPKATSHTTTTSATKPFIYSTIRWSIRTPYTPTGVATALTAIACGSSCGLPSIHSTTGLSFKARFGK